jgi:hypothetical protein
MPKKRGGNQNYKYIIENVDIDGDNIPDGVLVKQYWVDNNNHKHFTHQKFIPNDKLETELMHYQTNANSNKNIKIANDKAIARIENGADIPQTQNVVIQDNTSFAQYVKQGAGLGLGFAVTDFLTGLFTD